MVGTPAPWVAAIDAAQAAMPAGVPRIHLSAQGERFDRRIGARVREPAGLVLVASRYEGLDQRVIDARIDPRSVAQGLHPLRR
jgi:tRNA (guanine37-N1)-methyltransferase